MRIWAWICWSFLRVGGGELRRWQKRWSGERKVWKFLAQEFMKRAPCASNEMKRKRGSRRAGGDIISRQVAAPAIHRTPIGYTAAMARIGDVRDQMMYTDYRVGDNFPGRREMKLNFVGETKLRFFFFFGG